MQISRELHEQIVAHARAEAPNECCGMIAASGGTAVHVFEAENAAASPLRYELGPTQMLAILEEIEDRGWDLGAIYHSHTRSDPVPSQTDINLAFYPDSLYVIVGVKDPERAEVRAFRIVDGQVSEDQLEVR